MALGRRRLAIVCVLVEGGGCVDWERRRRQKFSKWPLEAEALKWVLRLLLGSAEVACTAGWTQASSKADDVGPGLLKPSCAAELG